MRSILIHIKLLLAILVMPLINLSVLEAEEMPGWTWMEYYPWAWSEDHQSWLYLVPDSPTSYDAYSSNTAEMLQLGEGLSITVGTIGGKTISLSPTSGSDRVTEIVERGSRMSLAYVKDNGVDVSCGWSGFRVNSQILFISFYPDVSTVGEYEGEPYSILLHFSTEDSGTYYFVGFGSDWESKGDFSLDDAVFLE